MRSIFRICNACILITINSTKINNISMNNLELPSNLAKLQKKIINQLQSKLSKTILPNDKGIALSKEFSEYDPSLNFAWKLQIRI